MEELIRTQMLLGQAAADSLKNKKVAIFGIGGVGSFCAEAIARCGVGEMLLADNDTVSASNINRQLIALHSTVGRYKTEVMKERILDINPQCRVYAETKCYTAAKEVDFSDCDFVVDAIDTVTSKLVLICEAKRLGIPIISSMGTGNKLDASSFRITDIYKTSVCPLARVMRRELKARGVSELKVLFSEEPPVTPKFQPEGEVKRSVPASISFVPSVAGLLIAGEVIRTLAEGSDKL